MVNYSRIKAIEIFSLIYQSKKDQKRKNQKYNLLQDLPENSMPIIKLNQKLMKLYS
jgi:hypothetical protein